MSYTPPGQNDDELYSFSPDALRIAEQLIADRVPSRICDKDATLWGEAAAVEAAERLNWVNPFPAATQTLLAADELKAVLAARGLDRIVLCGMGGSSLGPEVLAKWAAVDLTLLDSTNPNVVLRTLQEDIEHTVVVVSSKSGSTVETRSHLACFEAAFAAANIAVHERIVIVTDPGSALETYALSQGYKVFLADPFVGGRFSVLTAFGIVPSALAGAQMGNIISDAEHLHANVFANSIDNPAVRLASFIAAGLPDRYVLTIAETVGQNWGLGDWIEQLVAESTGKAGVGVLPISLPAIAPELTMDLTHVLNVHVSHANSVSVTQDNGVLEVAGPLGAQFLLWETATALLGHIMQIDPFNQPDVESAKVAARAALQEAHTGDDTSAHNVLGEKLTQEIIQALTPNGYLAIQAYVDPAGKMSEQLNCLRANFAQNLQAPVALGIGPRYLHSTGQLHKGGPKTGVFLQIIDDEVPSLDIPGSDTGFGELFRSQSGGDRAVLEEAGRPVFVVRLSDPAVKAHLAALSQ